MGLEWFFISIFDIFDVLFDVLIETKFNIFIICVDDGLQHCIDS